VKAFNMSEKKVAILSFFGGLVFISVLTALLLNKNSAIKEEVESQVQGFLNTSKDILRQSQLVVAKVGKITAEIKGVDNNDMVGVEPTALLSDGYNELWRSVEAQNKVYVKSHPS
jgi:hypothetical protein